MDMSVTRGSVVVGVDGSRASTAALDWGVRHAARGGHTLCVVHTCDFPPDTTYHEDVAANERGLRSAGAAIAREAVSYARLAEATVGVESVVTMGSPAETLVEASEAATIVVMGARGQGSFSSALLGSVSYAVTREAHCPVVVVRAFNASPDQPIVVGVDGRSTSTAAIEFAFEKADTDHLPLTVLHASWAGGTSAASFDELCEKYPDVRVTEVHRRGEPVRELTAASRTASLLVVGARCLRPSSMTLHGSVSSGVVERGDCTVAVVR